MVLFPSITFPSRPVVTSRSTTMNRHSPRTEFCASVAVQSRDAPTGTAFLKAELLACVERPAGDIQVRKHAAKAEGRDGSGRRQTAAILVGPQP